MVRLSAEETPGQLAHCVLGAGPSGKLPQSFDRRAALLECVAEVLPEREEVCGTCVRPSVEPEFRFQRWGSRHFRSGLMLTRHLADRHVSVSTEAVTVRRPGRPTEHRPLRDGELSDLVRELGVPLTRDEESRLLEVVDELRSAGRPRA